MLTSPTFNSAGVSCLMSFAYHFYGGNIGDMNVYLMNSTGSNLLFPINGNQGDVWHVKTLYIGHQLNPFTISFNATHEYGYMGDMALDDISFTGCDPRKTASMLVSCFS